MVNYAHFVKDNDHTKKLCAAGYWCIIELEKTALNRGRTDRISLTHDIDLQSHASYGHDLPACKSSRSAVVSWF